MPSEKKKNDVFEGAYKFVHSVTKHLSMNGGEGPVYILVPDLPKPDILRTVTWFWHDAIPVEVALFFEMDVFKNAPPYVDTQWWLQNWLLSMSTFFNQKAHGRCLDIWNLLTQVRIRPRVISFVR